MERKGWHGNLAHFYDSAGTLHDRVPNASKPGEYRDATITDARKNGWGPGVTTVQQILAKPGLTDWQMDQTIDAVLRTPRYIGSETGDREWRQQVKWAANEVRDTAADFGTQVHRAMDMLARGADRAMALEVGVAAYKVASEALTALTEAGLTIVEGERQFWNAQYGYGGTIDILGTWQGRPCAADIKTQKGTTVRDLSFYPEHPVQLAGYCVGIDDPDLDRVSLIVSREAPGVVAVRNWSTYVSKNGNGWPNSRGDAAWLATLELWKVMSNW